MSDENNGAPEGVTEDTSVADLVTEDQTLAQGDEQTGDEAPAAEDQPAPKPKKSTQERFDELTRLRRDAEREAEYWKAKALQPAQAQPAVQAQEQQPQGDGRPDPTQYDNGVYDPLYIEDLTDWKAEQAAQRLAGRMQQADRARSAVQTFQARTKELYPDGEPAGLEAFRRIETVPEAVNEILSVSEVAPKIAAHLGDNPAELARLARLTPVQQARELTLLETRLSAPPKPTPKTTTDAPDPPPQARGAGGRFTPAPDTNDFAAFEQLADGMLHGRKS